MIDLRPSLYLVGVLLSIVAVAMLLPASVDLAFGHADWRVFVVSSALTMFVGLALIFTNRGSRATLELREMFFLTTVVWIVIAAFSALPFVFSQLNMSYTNAFFEAMSGITTTGSTVMSGLEYASPGLLMWRAVLQFLGGLGIIVMAILILPTLRVGGMQLFRTESSDTADKALPRTAQNAMGVFLVYLLLSIICAVMYWRAGMAPFDAMCHAMTTIATGGFANTDQSFAQYDDGAIPWIASLFMALGALPFILYLRSIRSFSARANRADRLALFRDSQVQWFFSIVVLAVIFGAAYRAATTDEEYLTTLRDVLFNVVSIITGTGYSLGDYGQWGGFALIGFFFLTFIGGCAGSTSCGIKVFRFQILYATAILQIKRLRQPHGVFVAYYNGRPISDEVAASVMGFFFMFIISFAVIALVLGALGLDFLTAVSGAATAIANVGPGLGPVIGPAGNFDSLPDAAKWVLSAGMLLGRLELFTVFVLLTPTFWRS